MVVEAILPIVADLIKIPFKKYVVDPVLSPIIRRIGYAFKCDSMVETLQDQVEKLNNKRRRLQDSVYDATRNGEEIYDDVTEWLTTAGEDIEDAEKLIREKAEAMNKCFVGLCPNLKTRYQLSKKAHKKALAVDKQLQDAQAVPDPISFRPPIVEPSVYSSEALPSRVLILNQIMVALKDPYLKMIGVYGMGGVGKTTLAKEVMERAIQEKMLFDTVVMVVVSQYPDLRRIQGEIADSLGLKLDAEEVHGRASRLRQRLEKAKVLIILDDVWQKLYLSAAGIPSGDACQGCKILVTSRSWEVLRYEMLTQREFFLGVLNEEEAWRLFKMSTSNIADPELHDVATEISHRCGGWPLLTLKVAADLRGKESFVWKDMLNRLTIFKHPEETVHKVIESSYENLVDEEAKLLFLLCALFGESNISIHKLLIYSVGLGLFKRIESIEGARNRVLTLIGKLKSACLLLDGDRTGFVKIHDVVRDIARAISSREQNAFVGAGKVRSEDFQNKGCTRISLPDCDMSGLPRVLGCPEVEMFLLFAGGDHIDIQSPFFERVPKLKVVDFSGVYFVSGLPSSLGFLQGLQSLCLQRCRFNNVAIVAELKQLELLSFADSNIEELPGEIKALTRLKLFDLRDCRRLKVLPANVLSNMSLLEELYMLNSFSGWETDGNASLVELKDLSHLTTLEIQVSDYKLLPEDWFFDGVHNYRISIGKWPWFRNETSRRILKLEVETSVGLTHKIKEFVRGTEVLYLRDVKGVKNLLYGFGIENTDSGVFGELRKLCIYECNTLKSLSSHSFPKYLPQLQELEVESCCNMEAIAGEGSGDELIEFTQLTSLRLSDLPNLISFCKTSGMVSFLSITGMKIHKCNGLKYIFTNSMVKSLEQLKELELKECESVEEIILSEEIEVENINLIVFPKLERLEFQKLQKLKRFSNGHSIDFPSLKELKLEDCSGIEKLVSKSINRSYNNESVDGYLFNDMVSFLKLTTLVIKECSGLKYVFTNSMVKSFEQLKEFQIGSCKSLEDIILSEETEEASINRLVFPKLDFLKLEDLQELKTFSSGHPIDFPSLRALKIERCRAIKNFVSKFINRSNNNESVDECIFNEMVNFRNLEHLSIEGIDLKYVFHEWMACGLLQLQELEIRRCGVEVIFGNAEEIEWPNLKHLTVLDCPKLIKLGSNNSKVNFSNLETVDAGRSLMDAELLEGSRPHPNIEKTKIKFCLLALNNLVDLKLERCHNCVERPCLGILPHLENLEMNHMRTLKFIDNEFYGIDYAGSSSGSLILFPALRSFSLTLMENLTEWSYPSYGKTVVVFPSLQILSIQHCPKLTGFPMRDLSQLVRLEIKDCDELRLSNQKFTSLTGLSILGCSKLTNLRNWIQSIESFEELSVRKCEWLTFIPYDLQKVSYLTSLEIYCCRRLRYFPEVILSELTKLQNLSIGAFSEELDDFRYLNRIKDLPLLEV